jgi:protein-L-isoaspartate(D-aspartate) O-methyltransferase
MPYNEVNCPSREKALTVGQMWPAEDGWFVRARAAMVRDQLAGRGINDPRVLAAMGKVPRQQFIAPAYAKNAYDDAPLPIAAGQTISQPYMVGLMTQLLDPQPGQRVLEIGVGSGYQAAILAELAGEVVGVERIPALAQAAGLLLSEMGYANVVVYIGDGTQGWPDRAPYDGILVAAAGPSVPAALTDQLADGGRLIIPVGASGGEQVLMRVTRQGKLLLHENLIDVRFVPLIGRYGFKGQGGDEA